VQQFPERTGRARIDALQEFLQELIHADGGPGSKGVKGNNLCSSFRTPRSGDPEAILILNLRG